VPDRNACTQRARRAPEFRPEDARAPRGGSNRDMTREVGLPASRAQRDVLALTLASAAEKRL